MSLLRGAAHRPRVDPLTIVVALGALVVYELHGHAGSLTRDLGIYTYAGQQLLEGQAPYQAILNRAGPLAHVLPGVGVGGARLLGVDDVLGVRVFYMLIAVATVATVYSLGRRLFGCRAAALAGAAAMVSFHGFIEYAADGPREKTAMVFCLVLCCGAVHRRRWFRAGAWLSLATLFLQIAFPFGAGLFATAWLLQERGERLHALGRFVAGGLLPVAVVAAALAAVGALADAVDGFLLINLRYTVAHPPLANAGIVGRNVVHAYGWSFGVLVVGMLVLLVALVRGTRARARGDVLSATSGALAAYGGGLVAFGLWSLREFDSWADAFPALPVAAIGVAAAAAALGQRIGARPLAALVAVWAVVAAGLSAAWSVDRRSDDLAAQRRLAAATLGPLPADATFYSLEVPQPLVLGRRTSVSRLQTVAAGLDRYIDETHAGGLEGLGREIARRRTTVLFVHADEPVPTWLEPVLGDYEEVTGVENLWRTYLHRSLDARLRREVEEAARAADPD